MLHQHYENILSWLCDDVEHLSSNATDEIFRLRTIQEAHMASEIFSVLGFKVKIYDEDEYSRLYITKPRFDKETMEAKLESARAYAMTLKQIQQAMQKLRAVQKEVSGFDIKLLNSPDNSLTISITASKERVSRNIADETSPPEREVKPHPSVAHTASAARPARKKRPKEDDFRQLGGTALAKTHLMQNDAGEEKGALSRWLYKYIFRHVMTYSVELSIATILLLTLSALMITSKAFLCPDFATQEKDTAWYCDRSEIRVMLRIDTEEAEFPDIPGMKKN